ncbi:MAG: bifunctional DNA primase/polymerase [Nitrospirae bacterium]|nr:bifunctional DNA primase/polymerase [Nitrospirota bacterium]
MPGEYSPEPEFWELLFFYDVHGVKACGRGRCMSADILTAARGYTARGWVVHPLSSPKNKEKSPGKRPLLTGWQKRDRPATEAELDKWFKNMDNNICLVCGKASGVDAFDLDTDIVISRAATNTAIRLRITYTQHPEDQLLSLIKEKGSIMRSELPKNLRRTAKWALNLEKKGLIKRVHLKEGYAKRLQFVYIPQPPEGETDENREQ